MADDFADTLLRIYGDLGQQIAAHHDVSGALGAVTEVAVRSVPGAEFASITRRRSERFETYGSTDALATQADQIQYELGSGPCIDAVDKDNVFLSGDLRSDSRWPDFGPAAFDATGINSVLSIRMVLDDEGAMAGLNIYARPRDAFSDEAQTLGTLLATHGAVSVARAIAREKSTNLEIALTTSREIGIAMGVLMLQHKCTRDEAFDLLRIASQRTHRKLRELAAEVAETGVLEIR
jgi:GAF domain-containing protein